MKESEDACFKSLEERLRYLGQVAKTDVMRGSLAAAADRIESDAAKIDQMESDMSKMNGGRSCKVCGQDYIVAEIGEKMGFRIDVALLENSRQAKEIAEWEVLTSENVARIEELHDTIKKQEAKIEGLSLARDRAVYAFTIAEDELNRLLAVVERLGDINPLVEKRASYICYDALELKARLQYAHDNLNPPEK